MRTIGLLAAALLALGCDGGGSDITAPDQRSAATIVIISGDAQSAPAGSQLADSLVVRVTDSKDRPVAGQRVAFAASAGTVTPPAAATNADGRTGAIWVLGPVAGPQTATATATGSGAPSGLAVTFHATGTPAPTVAVGLGPFATGSGCSIQWPSSFYYSVAYDVNSAGVAVGETDCVAGEYLTFRWSQATGMQQLANYPGGYGTYGGRINEGGYIAAVFSTSNSLLDVRPIIWTPANARIDLGQPALCDPMGVCPPFDVSVGGINDENVVVGTFDGPFRWSEATGRVSLPTLGNRAPVAINGPGDIAGVSPGPYPAVGETALLSQAGALTLIDGFLAQDMNDRREMVGATGAWPATGAALWSQATGVKSLGTLGGTTSYAYGVNNYGEVVGSSTTADGAVHAFYWSASRGMVDLGPGIAYAISDADDMVGIGPSGFFPPEMEGEELWQATLWRGTGGVAASGVTARAAAAPAGRAGACFTDAANWQSKARMFRCLSRRSAAPAP
jgi:probable HAF family extracellular repeat protein